MEAERNDIRTTIAHHEAYDAIQKQLVDLLIADEVLEQLEPVA